MLLEESFFNIVVSKLITYRSLSFICTNMSKHSDKDQELAHEMVVEMLA